VLSGDVTKKIMGYDDSLDAFGVHCIGGIVGALLTGYSCKEIAGVDGPSSAAVGVGTTLFMDSGELRDPQYRCHARAARHRGTGT
jgi:ammonia channel protein AmtB